MKYTSKYKFSRIMNKHFLFTMRSYLYLVVMLLIIPAQKLCAQSNCDNIIEEATYLYNSGRYDECIQMLENGLNTCSLSKNKKENAYVLLSSSYIEKDSLQAIDKSFKQLLKNNPSFNITEYNPVDDFLKYLNHYDVYPRFTAGLRVPGSFIKIIPLKIYSVIPYANNHEPFVGTTDFKFNLFADYRINKKLSFFTDISAFALNLKRELKSDYFKLRSEENLKYLQLDLGQKYFFNVAKKINYFVSTGYSNLVLLDSKLTLNHTDIVVVKNKYTNLDNSDNLNEPKYFPENTNFNSQKLRNKLVYSIFFGAGAMYRFDPFSIGIDTRAYYTLNTLNNKSARFLEPELITKDNYIDSDLSMLKFDASIIFTYSWFKVENKKKLLNKDLLFCIKIQWN